MKAPRMNELWRLRNGGKQVVCSVTEVRDPARPAWDDARLGFELRADRNGELYLTELHRHREAIDVRSREMREALVERGWR